MTKQELWKLASTLARETAVEEGRLSPNGFNVTTGDIVVAAYQLGLDAGEHRAYAAGPSYRAGWRAGHRAGSLRLPGEHR